MKDYFTDLQETARQIESLASILQQSAENGELCNMGDEVAADMAEIIGEKATALRMQIDAARAAAIDAGAIAPPQAVRKPLFPAAYSQFLTNFPIKNARYIPLEINI